MFSKRDPIGIQSMEPPTLISPPKAVASTRKRSVGYPIIGFAELTNESTIAGYGYVDVPQLCNKVSTKSRISKSEIMQIIKDYDEKCKLANVDLRIALTQTIHETGWWAGSNRWRNPKYNFAGIAVYNDGSPGLGWKNQTEGILGHVSLLYRYANEDYPDFLDPRFRQVKAFKPGWVKRLSQLTGTWAADPKYHHKLIAVWETVRNASG